MPLAKISGEALTIIGVLISTNGFFLWYMFKGLKADVKNLSTDMKNIINNNAKLVHKTECHISAGRIHSRLDELDATQHEFESRMTRVETQLEMQD